MKAKNKIVNFLTLILMMSATLFSCDNSDSTSISPSNTSVVENSVELSKTNFIGKIGQQQTIEVLNANDDVVTLEYAPTSWYSLNVEQNKIFVSLIGEGEGQILVKCGQLEAATLKIQCIDLKFDLESYNVQVGTSLALKVNRDVQVTYTVDSEDVTLENGIITPRKATIFNVSAKYGDIVISEMFDSYPLIGNTINVLARDSVFVEYKGRNVHVDNKVILDNIGSGFKVQFYGTELKATLNGWYGEWYGKTKVSVLVDNDKDTTKNIITLTNGTLKHEYTLVSGLEEGLHTVEVLKRTEAISSKMSLFEIKTDGYFRPINKQRRLRIEAYGDSITAGYGNLRGALSDTTSSEYQSGLQTYATYAASALDADINVIARSGIGLCTAVGIESDKHVNSLYSKTSLDGEHDWNMHNYIPDLVIINLGTNDHWDVYNFEKERFITEYVTFIKNLMVIYGEDVNFILASGFMESMVHNFVKSVKARLNDENINNIYTIRFKQCAEGHPKFEEHYEGSKELVALIKDNNLDVFNDDNMQIDNEKVAQNEQVNLDLVVESKDVIPSYLNLYIKGLEDEAILLERDSLNPFVFNKNLTLLEGDYVVSLLLNNNEEYYEYSDTGIKTHTLKIRSNVDKYTLSINSFSLMPEDPNPNALTYGWEMSTRLFPATLSTVSSSEITVSNMNWMAAFVTRKASFGDDYKISATITAELVGNVSSNYIGLLPFYIDDHNFIVTYLQWNNDGSFKGIGCTGTLNGVNLGWNDFWSFANKDIDLVNGQDIEVSRHGKELTVKMGSVVETKTFALMTMQSERFGVWVCDGENGITAPRWSATYKNIQMVEEEKIEDPNKDKWTMSSHLFEASFTSEDDNSINLINNNWMAAFVTKGTDLSDNYIVSGTLKGTFTRVITDAYIGLVPFYADDSNYIVVYLQWSGENVIKSIGCTGKINGEDMGWNDYWSFAGENVDITQGVNLAIQKNGTKLKVMMNGIEETKTFAKLNLENIRYGVWCYGITSQFTNLNIIEA